MSMSEEQLQKTGLLRIMLDKQYEEDDMTILERIEMFEDKVEYMNIPQKEKEKIQNLIEQIKLEDSEKTQEFLFKELVKLVEEEYSFSFFVKLLSTREIGTYK
ncbi:MAG: hypothetical protein IJ193_01810 [Bacilli bacterium]|nr:hypothetical protein [Bacilli bacterium]